MTMLRISLSFFLVCSRKRGGVVVDVHRAEQRAVLEHDAEQRADLVELLGRALDDVGAVDQDLAALGRNSPIRDFRNTDFPVPEGPG